MCPPASSLCDVSGVCLVRIVCLSVCLSVWLAVCLAGWLLAGWLAVCVCIHLDCKTFPFFALDNRASAKRTCAVWGEQVSPRSPSNGCVTLALPRPRTFAWRSLDYPTQRKGMFCSLVCTCFIKGYKNKAASHSVHSLWMYASLCACARYWPGIDQVLARYWPGRNSVETIIPLVLGAWAWDGFSRYPFLKHYRLRNLVPA